jgi:hypothetical protein
VAPFDPVKEILYGFWCADGISPVANYAIFEELDDAQKPYRFVPVNVTKIFPKTPEGENQLAAFKTEFAVIAAYSTLGRGVVNNQRVSILPLNPTSDEEHKKHHLVYLEETYGPNKAEMMKPVYKKACNEAEKLWEYRSRGIDIYNWQQ